MIFSGYVGSDPVLYCTPRAVEAAIDSSKCIASASELRVEDENILQGGLAGVDVLNVMKAPISGRA